MTPAYYDRENESAACHSPCCDGVLRPVPGGTTTAWPDHATQRDELWSKIASHPMESLFSSSLWAEVLARTYGFQVQASTAQVNGKKAALLFSEIDDMSGRRIVSVPFADYCDPLTSDPESWPKLVAGLTSARVPILLRTLRNQLPAMDTRFRVTSRATWHGIDLTRPESVIWEGFPGVLRWSIRKAQRSGVTVREGRSLQDVEAFYQMHCHVRKRKYRLLPQPFAFFAHLHELLSPESRLTVLIAEFQGRPIAACFLIAWGDVIYDKFSASVDLGPRPNDLLIWEGMKLGIRKGLSLFDFGASDFTQPSLISFKRKFATEERTIQRLRWEPEGHIDDSSRDARLMLGRITDLLTDPSVPDQITRAAGDKLYALFC